MSFCIFLPLMSLLVYGYIWFWHRECPQNVYKIIYFHLKWTLFKIILSKQCICLLSFHLETASICPLYSHHCPVITFLFFLSHLTILHRSSCCSAFLESEQLKLCLFIFGRHSGGLSEVISRLSVEVERLQGTTAPCCVSWLSAPVLTMANKTRQCSENLCQHGSNQLTVARSTCYQRGPEKCCKKARC